MLYAYASIALVVINTSCALHNQRVEEKETASVHNWVKSTRQLPRIIGLSPALRQPFVLLARGYQETGSCLTPSRVSQQVQEVLEKLESPGLPVVITRLILEYFTSCPTLATIKQRFSDNAWILFEEHIGERLSSSDTIELSSELWKKFLPAIDRVPDPDNSLALSVMIVRACLDDLQSLAKEGHADNPYEWSIRYDSMISEVCEHCNKPYSRDNKIDSYLEINKEEFSYLMHSTVDSSAKRLSSRRVPCSQCGAANAFRVNRVFSKFPQLCMLIPHYAVFAKDYAPLGKEPFSFCGALMEHYNQKYGKGIMVHVREADGRERYSYHSNCDIQECDMISGKGTLDMWAMLYRYNPQVKSKNTGPNSNP